LRELAYKLDTAQRSALVAPMAAMTTGARTDADLDSADESDSDVTSIRLPASSTDPTKSPYIKAVRRTCNISDAELALQYVATLHPVVHQAFLSDYNKGLIPYPEILNVSNMVSIVSAYKATALDLHGKPHEVDAGGKRQLMMAAHKHKSNLNKRNQQNQANQRKNDDTQATTAASSSGSTKPCEICQVPHPTGDCPHLAAAHASAKKPNLNVAGGGVPSKS
jgi:hypothetical protein